MRRLSAPSMPRLRSTAAFGMASALANVLGYVTSVVLARGLSSDELGAVGALLALGIIGTIPYTALQLAVSRRAGDALTSGGLSRASAALAGLVVGLALSAVFALAAWPLAGYLNLEHAWYVLGIGAVLVPMLVTAALNGVLLGEERIGRLAWSSLVSASTRVATVLVAVLTGGGVGRVLVCLVIGALAAGVVVYLLAPRGVARLPVGTGAHAMTASAVVLTGALLLTNLDVPMARHHLTGSDSGVYVIGAIFTKVCLWGPQFLAVVTFPRMHRAGGQSRTAWVIGLTAAFGLAIAAVLVPAGPLVVTAIAGREVPVAASLAPVFALLGTAWAVVNVVVLHDIATRPRDPGLWVWAATAALVVGFAVQPTPTTVAPLVTWALVVSAGAAVAGVVRLRVHGRRVVGDPVGPLPVDRAGQPTQGL